MENHWDVAAKVTQVLVSATLASPTANTTNSFDLVKLPPETAASVANELEEVAIPKPAEKAKVAEQFGQVPGVHEAVRRRLLGVKPSQRHRGA